MRYIVKFEKSYQWLVIDTTTMHAVSYRYTKAFAEADAAQFNRLGDHKDCVGAMP